MIRQLFQSWWDFEIKHMNILYHIIVHYFEFHNTQRARSSKPSTEFYNWFSSWFFFYLQFADSPGKIVKFTYKLFSESSTVFSGSQILKHVSLFIAHFFFVIDVSVNWLYMSKNLSHGCHSLLSWRWFKNKRFIWTRMSTALK